MPCVKVKVISPENHTKRIHTLQAPNVDISISKQVTDPVWQRETNKMGNFMCSNTGAVTSSRETFYFARLEAPLGHEVALRSTYPLCVLIWAVPKSDVKPRNKPDGQ